MPRGSWTKKDERKYEKILDSCKLERRKGKKRSVATCKRIAAATVNRDRKVRLRGTPEEHRARSEAFQDLLAFYAGRVPESLERQLQALGDENWQWATGAARDPENLAHWEYALDRSLSPGEQRTSRMLQGLRGLRGKTDDGEMWRKAAELWRDYYREHQPMTPAERRAFLAEKRAWLHSQEARDMGEAYGWSYNDEDD